MGLKQVIQRVQSGTERKRKHWAPRPGSWSLGMYHYWYREAPHKAPKRENFCHYWRVVFYCCVDVTWGRFTRFVGRHEQLAWLSFLAIALGGLFFGGARTSGTLIAAYALGIIYLVLASWVTISVLFVSDKAPEGALELLAVLLSLPVVLPVAVVFLIGRALWALFGRLRRLSRRFNMSRIFASIAIVLLLLLIIQGLIVRPLFTIVLAVIICAVYAAFLLLLALTEKAEDRARKRKNQREAQVSRYLNAHPGVSWKEAKRATRPKHWWMGAFGMLWRVLAVIGNFVCLLGTLVFRLKTKACPLVDLPNNQRVVEAQAIEM